MSICTVKCEICHDAFGKYRCPCCKLVSCSLSCVSRHKLSNKCDGVRDKVGPVSLNEFTDLQLLSDYRFLEDTQRKIETAARVACKTKRKRHPNHVNKVIKQAQKRGIRLIILPNSFERRKSNRTYYHIRKQTIEWSVDWKFFSANAEYVNKVMEDSTLSEALEHFLNPNFSDILVRSVLKAYSQCSLNDIKLFLKAENIKGNSDRYLELDILKTLKENLVGKVLVEYPKIFVVLSKDWSLFQSHSNKNINIEDHLPSTSFDSVKISCI